MTLKTLTPALLTLAAVAVAAPAPAKERSATGEAELAQALEGRTAGEPQLCLGTLERRNIRVIDGTALVFGSGDTIYVNRPEGAKLLDWTDVPVFKMWGSELCAKDQVELRDSSSAIPGPVLLLGEFVPYRRTG